MHSSALALLAARTELSMDSARFLEASRFGPTHATTNPSLILKACEDGEYDALVSDSIRLHRNEGTRGIADRILLRFCTEMLERIPGQVSLEIDARQASSVEGSLSHARRIVHLCREAGVRDRVLVKIPATWEGIQAADALRREGVPCNMTLVFSMLQALLCARRCLYLISPFVGRISDCMPATQGRPGNADQGVALLLRIHSRLRQEGHGTKIMAASFRNERQVIMSAPCGLVTIGESIMLRLSAMRAHGMPTAGAPGNVDLPCCPAPQDSHGFYRALSQNRTAWRELARGVDAFAHDDMALARLISSRLP
ncbi:Transaldolase [Candidatus Tremblaya princeps]|uniref:transaldolase n=1 Tax=Tremblaya princeps TaxID=189385 RepID=A0A143WPC9_TREPR|nr:Transaldolase [Candidatus Tremblaya princeps]